MDARERDAASTGDQCQENVWRREDERRWSKEKNRKPGPEPSWIFFMADVAGEEVSRGGKKIEKVGKVVYRGGCQDRRFTSHEVVVSLRVHTYFFSFFFFCVNAFLRVGSLRNWPSLKEYQ